MPQERLENLTQNQDVDFQKRKEELIAEYKEAQKDGSFEGKKKVNEILKKMIDLEVKSRERVEEKQYENAIESIKESEREKINIARYFLIKAALARNAALGDAASKEFYDQSLEKKKQVAKSVNLNLSNNFNIDDFKKKVSSAAAGSDVSGGFRKIAFDLLELSPKIRIKYLEEIDKFFKERIYTFRTWVYHGAALQFYGSLSLEEKKLCRESINKMLCKADSGPDTDIGWEWKSSLLYFGSLPPEEKNISSEISKLAEKVKNNFESDSKKDLHNSYGDDLADIQEYYNNHFLYCNVSSLNPDDIPVILIADYLLGFDYTKETLSDSVKKALEKHFGFLKDFAY